MSKHMWPLKALKSGKNAVTLFEIRYGYMVPHDGYTSPAAPLAVSKSEFLFLDAILIPDSTG